MNLTAQINALGVSQALEPPDTQLAAGPSALVEMDNDTGSVWTKTGTLIQLFDLNTFFGVASGYSFSDPRIIYDLGSGRFFASGFAHDAGGNSEVFAALSKGSDPTAGWDDYVLSANTSGILYDQPKLGVSTDKVVVSWNDFVGATFTGQETWVLEKADMLSLSSVHNAHFGPDSSRFAIAPAQPLSATSTAWAAWTSPNAGSALGVVAIVGTPAAGNLQWLEADPAISSMTLPPNAAQPGGGAALATDDNRIISAVWDNRELFVAANDGCVPAGDATTRSCLRLIGVTTAQASVVTDTDIGLANSYLFYPAVSFDSSGNLYVSLTVSSTTTDASAATMTFPIGGSPTLLTIQSGQSVYASPNSPPRWGDYSAAATDPAQPSDVWLTAEYAASSGWGTATARMTLSGPTVTSISPSSGPVAGGTTVIISGADFVAGLSAVAFGATPATTTIVDDPTRITAVSPPGTPGPVAITVTTPNGTSPQTLADTFSYATAPGAPLAVTARSGRGEAIVSWLPPASDGFSPITSYTISASDGIHSAVVAGGVTSVALTSLSGGQSYTFSVTATNAVASGPPSVSAPTPVYGHDETGGYWLVASDGGIFAFATAHFYGSTGGIHLNKPIVAMTSTADGRGYWLVASDGGIFSFGDAHFYGSTGGTHLNKPIVGMTATADGRGYWLVASDGGIFAFGDAKFFGSTGALVLNRPIVAMASTPDGQGYWLVASDGGIFAFGDAKFHGSTGSLTLNKPIVNLASTPSGNGYWLVASDGGIFAFGDAGFHGSTGAIVLNRPIVDIVAPNAGGYWLVASDGGIFAFGSAAYHGSTGALHLNQPVVAATA